MSSPTARYLDGHDAGRLHLQHGPIDLVIGVDEARPGQRARAFEAAHGRFQTILAELVSELPLLKQAAASQFTGPSGPTARRMWAAVLPFSRDHFITPMAAVAGSVADEMLASILAAFAADDRPLRLSVNNGGDIALYLAEGQSYRLRMVREDGADLGDFSIRSDERLRGVATSGRGGRSLSMGIADSVTVIAENAASADAATTLIANAVDLPGHEAISRKPASDLVDQSDLGTRLVVTECGPLDTHEIDLALEAGRDLACRFIDLGLIDRAALFLRHRGVIATNDAQKRSSFSQPYLPAERDIHA